MEKEMTSEKKKKGGIRVPHTYVLLFIVVVLMAILTYFVPAGEFDRAEDPATGRIFVVADSYHSVESNPAGFFDIFTAIPKGMEKSGYIIFFVLLIGGSFGILQATGAIDAGIGHIVKRMQGREKLIIPILMIVFSLAGAVLGSAEELLPFYPIVISLALALGFDTITGTSIVLLGAGAGFAGAFLNPFTVGIAQGIAGLPLFSGLWFRVVAFVLILGVAIIYVYRYASKIHKNPELSFTYEQDKTKHQEFSLGEVAEFTNKHKLVLAVFAIGLIILTFGVVNAVLDISPLHEKTTLYAGTISEFDPINIENGEYFVAIAEASDQSIRYYHGILKVNNQDASISIDSVESSEPDDAGSRMAFATASVRNESEPNDTRNTADRIYDDDMIRWDGVICTACPVHIPIFLLPTGR